MSKAQRVVSYFRASHRPLALLLKEASHLNINATPVTSNTTRFTSVHLCLDVMDISDVDLLEAPTLDSFTQEPVPEPEELVEKLSNFYLKDITDSAGQPPQSFTDLLLSDKDFVLHPQFDPTYVPAYQPAAQQSTVGNLSGSVEQVNAGDFVKSLFANMGKIE